MSKILNYYNNKTHIDKTWYDSSNVLYSECDDIENDYKNVKVTFKNGSTYEYKNVDVNDYIMFRENISQGKSINKFIKIYECEKLENKDTDKINEELLSLKDICNDILKEDVNIIINDEVIRSFNGNRMVDIDVSTHDKESVLLVVEVLKSIGIKIKIE